MKIIQIMNHFITLPNKIYIDKSPVHGIGVFAKFDIEQNELIEECPVLTLPIQKGEPSSLLIDYRFNWPQGLEFEEQVIALGYGSIYNHSNTPNAHWISDIEKRTFKFISNRKINAGEEIFTWYGDVNYWNSRKDPSLIV
jgi:SET domain-containing protein